MRVVLENQVRTTNLDAHRVAHYHAAMTQEGSFSVITSRTDLERDLSPESKAHLIGLILQQLHADGSDADTNHVETALHRAFHPGSRAVLFVWRDQDRLPGAFAFGNVGSGLETGSDYLWLNELHVHHPFRRRGLASGMLTFVREWAEENGIASIACVTGVNNLPAQGMYKTNGFEVSPVMWVSARV
jgi:GNAT superfamily N-acetyltransferase